MAGTGIGTDSGDAAGSVGSGIGDNFIRSPNSSWTDRYKFLLSQQHLASCGYVGVVSVKPLFFYRKNPGVWFHRMEPQFVLAETNDETKIHHILVAIP